MLQPKTNHQASKILFRIFCCIGLYLVVKVLPNINYTVRKLNAGQTQNQHRIRMRNYNHEKPPEDSYQEVQWQIDVNIITFQGDINFLA